MSHFICNAIELYVQNIVMFVLVYQQIGLASLRCFGFKVDL